MSAPTIPVTQSPYWLRLYGKWIHLEGIAPEVSVDPARAFSELTTVDGYRYEQRSPRGPRSWVLDYQYATAAATAALESASYSITLATGAASGQVLLLDVNQAKVNMVRPDLLALWRNPNVTSGPLVYNVGESEGQPIWLPTYDGDGVIGYRTASIPVRAGVTYTATVWTTLGTGTVALQLTGAATASSNGLNGSTVTNPHQSTIVFTPVADGVVNVRTTVGFTAGLMVYEGNCAPTSYRAGRRMPCQISVQDPTLGTNVIWPASCNPCDLPREQSSWVLHEVGIDAVTPLDIGVS